MCVSLYFSLFTYSFWVLGTGDGGLKQGECVLSTLLRIFCLIKGGLGRVLRVFLVVFVVGEGRGVVYGNGAGTWKNSSKNKAPLF